MHGNVLHAQTGHFLAFAFAISPQIDDDLDSHLGQGLKTMFARLGAPVERRTYLREVWNELFADDSSRSINRALQRFGLLGGWLRWSRTILRIRWYTRVSSKPRRATKRRCIRADREEQIK